jgi:hypothetical protein
MAGLLGALVALGSWLACGVSLGTFFAPFFLLTLAGCHSSHDGSLRCHEWHPTFFVVGACVPTLVLWLAIAHAAQVSIASCLLTWLMLFVFVASVSAVAQLTRLRSLTIAFALAWLSWPIWLSPHVSNVNWLVTLHPLLAINSLLQDLGIWSQQPLAYQLTALGQDVEYTLPSPRFSIAFHAIVAAAGVGLAIARPSARTPHAPA